MDLYHKLCNSRHGEKQNTFEDLNMIDTSLSRMDVMEEDEVHYDLVSRENDCKICEGILTSIRKLSILDFFSPVMTLIN